MGGIVGGHNFVQFEFLNYSVVLGAVQSRNLDADGPERDSDESDRVGKFMRNSGVEEGDR